MKKNKLTKNNYQKEPRNTFENWLDRVVPIILQQYSISGVSISFHERKQANNKENKGTVVFRINYSDAYKTANIWYYPIALELYKKKDWVALEQAITHELAHIVTGRIASLARERFINERELVDTIENVTESFAQICRKLLKAKEIKIV